MCRRCGWFTRQCIIGNILFCAICQADSCLACVFSTTMRATRARLWSRFSVVRLRLRRWHSSAHLTPQARAHSNCRWCGGSCHRSIANLSRSSIADGEGRAGVTHRVASIAKRLSRIISGQALRVPAGRVPAVRGKLPSVSTARTRRAAMDRISSLSTTSSPLVTDAPLIKIFGGFTTHFLFLPLLLPYLRNFPIMHQC